MRFLLLGVGLLVGLPAVPGSLLAQVSEPDSPPAPAIQFRPTRAQQQYPRVRAARERRTEDIRKLFTGAGVDYPPERVLLRIFKKEDLLELWVRPKNKKEYRHLKDYAICSRSGELGPKRRRGDLQVPEGFYRLSRFNPVSNFLLSMLVDYPNVSDRIRGHQKNPGGDIFIHGDCVTIGCVPITDRWIEELYLICLDSKWRTSVWPEVHIFPTRLDPQGMAWLEKEFQDRPGHISLWKELQPGYGFFEETRVPPRVTIWKDGSYHFRKRRGTGKKPGDKVD